MGARRRPCDLAQIWAAIGGWGGFEIIGRHE
jgi:hypothetical protein